MDDSTLTDRLESIARVLVGLLITIPVVLVLYSFARAIVAGPFLYDATRPVYPFSIHVLLGAFFNDVNQGLQTGGVTSVIFGVRSQFFEPKTEPSR